jgi:hypothetical protein
MAEMAQQQQDHLSGASDAGHTAHLVTLCQSMDTLQMDTSAPVYQEISQSAIRCAEREVCEKTDLYADWLYAEHGEAREASAFFGPISTDELAQVLLNDCAKPEQIVAAARELRSRYLADMRGTVERIAGEYMEAQ